MFILDLTQAWVYFKSDSKNIGITQSIISFFLNFSTNSFYKSIFSKIVSLTGYDFLNIRTISWSNYADSFSLNLWKSKESHLNKHSFWNLAL